METATEATATEARGATFLMPLFKPGIEVTQNGRREKISHVILRRRELMVYLIGHEDPVKPNQLLLAPSLFTTERRPEQLHWYL
ncbi:hypothetical protein [Comamonas composti]|uniref:hypothetical protein n=1 Tax=Comamonas composti TaxID=408558 RepID=UPI00040F701F|nr:hypothetical protein [Comamonas composti]